MIEKETKIKVFDYFKEDKVYHYAIFIILIFGITARLVQFQHNRSLWLDEAMLALNMVQLDYMDLFKPLIWWQAGPILFLIGTKFVSSFFDYSEYGLRLIPFLSGVLSLILFRKLAIDLLQKPIAVIIAISMFAFSFYAVYFSVEFKQYSSDALFTIILLLNAFNVYKQNYSKLSIFMCGIMGVIAIFASYTSIFILAAIGSALLIESFLKHKNPFNSDSTKISLLSFIWLIVFGINYLFVIKGTDHEVFYDFWTSGFAPIFPSSIIDLMWYPKKAYEIIKNPLGFFNRSELSFLTIIVLLTGFSGVISLIQRKKYFILLLLCLPLLFLFLASSLKLYPIKTRLIFFTVPLFYLLIAEGGYHIYKNLKNIHFFVGATFIFLLLCSPVWSGINLTFKPYHYQETRPLVEYLNKEFRESDKLYVYYGTVPAFDYYTRNSKLSYIRGTYSAKYLDLCAAEIVENSENKDLWILFSHISDDKIGIITHQLSKNGEIKKIKQTVGASLYKFIGSA